VKVHRRTSTYILSDRPAFVTYTLAVQEVVVPGPRSNVSIEGPTRRRKVSLVIVQ